MGIALEGGAGVEAVPHWQLLTRRWYGIASLGCFSLGSYMHNWTNLLERRQTILRVLGATNMIALSRAAASILGADGRYSHTASDNTVNIFIQEATRTESYS